MSDLKWKCPHCHSDATPGDTVCRGCGAAIKSGTPIVVYFFILAIGIYFGSIALAILPAQLEPLAWIAGIASSLGALQLSSRIFKRRVKFTRYYRDYHA